MDGTPDQVQDLLDRAAILDCVQRYARGIDRHDVELVTSAYYPDAVDDHGLYVGSGDGLAVWANNHAHRGLVRHQHHLTNHSVDLEGDTAHAETYYLVVTRSETGTVRLGSGRYLDRFERRAGEWKIADRVTLVETVSDLGSSDMEELDRAFAAPAQNRSDPSYRRPLRVSRRSADEPHQASSE
jgi:ketosteroid isomerase-like protein